MKKRISFYEFQKEFKELRPDNFSDEGLRKMFEFLEDYEEETGAEIDLDVIAICCDFAETDFESFSKEYEDAPKQKDCEDEEQWKNKIIEYLENNTIFIAIDKDNFIYQCF